VAAQATSNYNWLSSLRGRLGYTWGPGLVYITGGGAWASSEVKTLVCDTAFAACTANNFGNILSGWTLGAGFEWMMAPNWIARAEYLFYSLGNSTNNVGAFTTPVGGLAGSGVNLGTSSAKLNVIRLGLEYKFDWH
jgi:outer membrane immunogenic protein